MKTINILLVAIFASILLSQCKSQKKTNKETIVELETTMGTMKIKLYDETPEHKKNFLKLIDENYYDGVLFHRVIKNFMIQGGDPDSKTAKKGQTLGSGGPGYTIPAEFNSMFIHKKGALSAARTGGPSNPEMRSSGSQFYVVQGQKYTDEQLNQMEEKAEMNKLGKFIRPFIEDPKNESIKKEIEILQKANNRQGLDSIVKVITTLIKKQHPEIKFQKYTKQQRETYKTIGGTPYLDGAYTVYGEVIEGIKIIDKIANVETNKGDRPIEDVKIISVKVVK